MHAKVLRHVEVGGVYLNEYVQTRSTPWHRHDEVNLALIIDGAGLSATRSDEFAYGRGHVVFESFDLPQRHECTGLRCLNVHFSPDIVRDNGCTPPGFARMQCFERGPNVQLMRRMYAEMQVGDAASRLALHGLTLELVADLMRAGIAVERATPPWVRSAEEYIRAHFTRTISLDALAGEVRLHPAHLSRSFRKFVGCTVGEYVRKMRVDHAVRLITQTELPLPMIALSSGFCDQSDMTRLVKRWTGRTPARHRAQHRPR